MLYLFLMILALVVLWLAARVPNEALDSYGRRAVLYDKENRNTYSLSPLSMLGGKGMTLGGVCTEIPLEGVGKKETLASVYLVGSDFRIRAMEGVVRGNHKNQQKFTLKKGSGLEDESLWDLDRIELCLKDGQPVANMIFCRGTIVPESVKKDTENLEIEHSRELVSAGK